jgi:glycosidase
MKGDKNKGDAYIRKDFPGGWAGDNHNAFKAEGRTSEEQAYFEFTKKLLNWRKTKNVIHTGKLVQFIPENNVYVYFRSNGTETVMVVLNNSIKEEKLQKDRFASQFVGFVKGVDVLSSVKVDLTKSEWKVPAKTAFIFELK